jgi:hypothetical protein
MRRGRRVLRTGLCCLVVAACAKDEAAPAARPADSAAFARPDSVVTASAPDSTIVNRVINQRVVLYVMPTEAEWANAKAESSDSDFEVIGDDLMFYRSTAIEYLEKAGYPLVHIQGRRAIQFIVNNVPRGYDFADVTTLDFIVAYEPGREPRTFAPNEVEMVAAYFGDGN